MTRSPRRPHGFATVVALMLLGLVAAALAVSAAAATADLRRTRAAAAGAQLRQLLSAGGADVAAHAARWPAAAPADDWSVPLPPALSDDGYAVAVHVTVNGATAHADVIATGAGRRLGQRITFVDTSGRWRPTAAILGQEQASE